MENKLKISLSYMLIILTIIFFAGCSKSSTDQSQTSQNINICGTYKLASISDPEQSVTSEDLALLDSIGLQAILVLNENGLGYIDLFGENIPITYDIDKQIITTTDDTGESNNPFTYENGVITFEENGSSLTFVLQTDSENSNVN